MPKDLTHAVVNVRVEKNVKRQAEELFDSLGMNISTAVNMFFKQSIMENALPFHPKKVNRHIPLQERLVKDNSDYKFEKRDTGPPVC